MGELRTTFLEDGAQPASATVDVLTSWIEAATTSLWVAIYDFDVIDPSTAPVARALEAASRRGVDVRIAFNREPSHDADAARPMHRDPAEVDALDVPTRPVSDQGELMHHKYVVRDGNDVWTGSTNWTPDAFTREENAILELTDVPELASAYAANFERIWRRGHLDRTGSEGPSTTLARGIEAQVAFSPAPPWLSLDAAHMIAAADRRVRICSPVVTSGAVLALLAEHAERRSLELGGAFDRTQMEDARRQWQAVEHNRWKIAAWDTIAPHLSGKVSTPYAPGSVHDYMHAKFLVVDDEVMTGSFNFSRHGEGNAENVVHLRSEEVAVTFEAFAERVATRYADASTATRADASGSAAGQT
jgi:phosphatidylserine/phosphatidylglycerophosphate/cardiolipin synthase-like enzyme